MPSGIAYQVDPGTYGGRRTAGSLTDPPVLWVWRGVAPTQAGPVDAEFWALRTATKSGLPAYTPCDASSPRSYLDIALISLPGFTSTPSSPGDPSDASQRAAFLQAVCTYHSNSGLAPVQPSEFRGFLYMPGVASVGAAMPRVVGTGLFRVYETAHPTYPSLPLAWIWSPQIPGDRDVWALRTTSPDPKFRLLGTAFPSSGFWIEMVMPETYWNYTAEKALSFQALRNWIAAVDAVPAGDLDITDWATLDV
jgi:hypothetical protein